MQRIGTLLQVVIVLAESRQNDSQNLKMVYQTGK